MKRRRANAWPGAWLAACALASLGCEAQLQRRALPEGAPAASPAPTPQTPEARGPEPLPRAALLLELHAMTPEATQAYLARMAPMLAQRALTPQELERVWREGGAAIRPTIQAWTSAPAFERVARAMIQLKLSTSGQRDGVNYELPGNLAAHMVRQALPVKTLLTASYCVDDDGQRVGCDTGAPYTAGVLATRAFMAGNASRFNLHRAAIMLKTFGCSGYPLDYAVEPPLERDALIPMFRITDEADDTTGGFGNGLACYSCHSQFGAHAQLFVRFDQDGVWRAEATGEQDPQGELGRSLNGLYTSHMEDPSRASSEASQMFGLPVQDLSEAAQALADSPAFLPCAARNLIEYAFSLDEAQAQRVRHALLTQIAALAVDLDGDEPTLQTLALETFAHPAVVKIITQAHQQEAP